MSLERPTDIPTPVITWGVDLNTLDSGLVGFRPVILSV